MGVRFGSVRDLISSSMIEEISSHADIYRLCKLRSFYLEVVRSLLYGISSNNELFVESSRIFDGTKIQFLFELKSITEKVSQILKMLSFSDYFDI